MPIPIQHSSLILWLFPDLRRLAVLRNIDRDFWSALKPLAFTRRNRIVWNGLFIITLATAHALYSYHDNVETDPILRQELKTSSKAGSPSYQENLWAGLKHLGVIPNQGLNNSWMWVVVPTGGYCWILMYMCGVLLTLVRSHTYALGCRRCCRVAAALTILLLGVQLLAVFLPKACLLINYSSPVFLGTQQDLLPVEPLVSYGQPVFDLVCLPAAVLYRLIMWVHARNEFREYCRILELPFHPMSTQLFLLDLALEVLCACCISFYGHVWMLNVLLPVSSIYDIIL